MPYSSVSTFAKVGAVKATAKTDNTCIISVDGVGIIAPVVVNGFGTHTIPQVAYAALSFFKKAKVQYWPMW